MVNNKPKKATAEYHYPQAVKLRYDDKSFCWKHWEGDRLVYGRGDIPHSLYHAEKIPDSDTVFLAEGEKDADTLCAMGLCGVSTEDGASKNLQKPKWYPEYTAQLKGKHVVILNDSDEAGRAHAESCADLLYGEAEQVQWVKLEELWPEVPEKGDISDMVSVLGIEETKGLLLERLSRTPEWVFTDKSVPDPVWEVLGVPPMKLSEQWNIRMTGLGRLIRRTGTECIYEPFSSTPIVPVAIYQNRDTGEQDVRLRALIGKKPMEFTIPRKVLSVNQKLVEALSAKGVDVITGTARYMAAYFSDLLRYENEIPMLQSVNHLGWVDEDFLPYSGESRVKFSNEEIDRSTYDAAKSQKGTLQEWVDFVLPLRKNMAVRLMMAASFASPLITLVGAQPFLVHLWGTTGIGKTVALRLAMSIWGNPQNDGLVSTTDNTLAAMCITASMLQHLPFAADELQLVKKKPGENYDKFIMTFCEGKERGRANQNAEKRKQRTWKSCALVTGEEPITEANSGGGAKNRTIELKSTSKLFADPAGVVEFIENHFGTAGRAYISYVQAVGSEQLKVLHRDIRNLLEKTEVTEKQKDAAALIMLGDMVSQLSVFPNEPMLDVNDVLPYLKSAAEVRTSDRAKEFLVDWITENIGHFPKVIEDSRLERKNQALTVDEPQVQTYGVIVGKERVVIIYSVLRNILLQEGFNLISVADDWMEDGFLERCITRSAGDKTPWKKQVAIVVQSYADAKCISKELRPRCCILHLSPDWTDQADNAEDIGKLGENENLHRFSQLSMEDSQFENTDKCS